MSIAIIGGGASGMILAAKLYNKNVTIFEKNSKLGKKLLITSNGKCNFTSGEFSNIDTIFNNDFSREIYKKYNEKSCIKFYSSIGILPKIEIHKNQKYYYPNSNKSTSVYYNLLDKIIENNTKIILNTNIKDIKYDNNSFILYDDSGKQYVFDKIVLATGGMTYKNTGSDGYGYILAKRFGHSIIKPLPALCALKTTNSFIGKIKNIRVDAFVSAWEKNDSSFCYIDSDFGEIQFTEYGISGIPIFNLSRRINRLIEMKKQVIVYLNFLYNKDLDINENTDMVIRQLKERRSYISYKKALDFLCGYLPDEIARVIMNVSLIDNKKMVSDINDSEIKAIAENIVSFRVDISTYADENTAQITIGGIDTNEIDINTLMSKIVKNLYFTGEIMDIDGRCGGYNLQLAYSTASIVADSILGGNL